MLALRPGQLVMNILGLCLIMGCLGAPQNHWFGPAGDPRSAGIGTIEAIRHVWSCHREIIYDHVLNYDMEKLETS